MFENNHRVGRFTSSKIHMLMSNGRKKGEPGAPFKTYVSQKKRERKLGRSLDLGKGNRSTAWGHLMEAWVMYKKLGFNYAHHGATTTIHHDFDYWAGTADLVEAGVKVGDIKCFEPDNFTKLAEVLQQQDVEVFKKEYTAEYWQLVSNACIHSVTKAELVLYMPYKSELEDIRDWLNGDDIDEVTSNNLHRYRYIMDASDEELPYLPDDCEAYNSLESFEFDIPQEDIDALIERIKMAGELACQR